MSILMILIKASMASCAYALLLELRGKALVASSVNGGIAWVIFEIFPKDNSDLIAYFAASVVFSFLSEIMARRFKKPATIFIVVALLPLVPGELIYKTMKQMVTSSAGTIGFNNLTRTFAISTALSLGILIVSTLAKMYNQKHT